MLKMSFRRFAFSALVLAMSTEYASAQLLETPAPPRRDTPRSIDEQPSADSRAGGALSRDADPVRGAEIVDESYLPGVTDRDGEAGDVDADGPVYGGVITNISKGQITIRSAPRRAGVVTNQTFKVPIGTPVVANGRRATLSALQKGQTVMVHATPGDPEMALKIVAATTPREEGGTETADQNASDSDVPQLDDSVNWEEHPVAPGLPGEEERAARGIGREEAVLPLGIEVFGPGQGALVTEMMVEGAAAQAGVQIGDYITQVNGKPVGDPELIEEMMADGEGQVVLTVLRGGEVLQLDVQPVAVAEGAITGMPAIRQALANYASIGQANMNRAAAVNRAAVANTAAVNPFGGTLAPYDGNGVLLNGAPGTLATGLLPNDVIVGFNGLPITNQADLQNALNGFTPNGQVPLSIQRGGQTTTVNLPASAFRAGSPANLDARARSLGRPSPAGTGAAAARATNGQAVPQGTSAVTGAAVQGGQTPRGAIQQGTTQGGLQQGAGTQGGATGSAQPQ